MVTQLQVLEPGFEPSSLTILIFYKGKGIAGEALEVISQLFDLSAQVLPCSEALHGFPWPRDSLA